MLLLGIIFALMALLSWGFGDFFIQRSVRLVGSIRSLIYIVAIGTVVLFPFVYRDLRSLLSHPRELSILLAASLVLFFASLFNFEGLKQGKISVIEPVFSLELPFTIFLGMWLLNESVTWPQALAMSAVFVGILLAITTRRISIRNHRGLFERGVLLAGIGAIVMALANFTFGVSSQTTSPLLTLWFTNLILTICSSAILLIKKERLSFVADFAKFPLPLTAMVVFDNIAWLSYAYAVTVIPISIAITLSETYIVLAVLLGVFFNHEKLKKHQAVGTALAIAGVLALSILTAG